MKLQKFITLMSMLTLLVQVPLVTYAESRVPIDGDDFDNSHSLKETISSTQNTSESVTIESDQVKINSDTSLESQEEYTSNTETVESGYLNSESNNEEEKFESSENVSEIVEKDSKSNVNQSKEMETIVIPDPILNRSIHTTLGIALETELTKDDLKKLTDLSISDSRILENLEGLQYASNLKRFSLISRFRSTIDFSTLSDLVSLESLTIVGSATGKLEDITFLSNLTNLKILNLDQNNIKNISPIVGLKQLTELTLDANPISESFISTIGELKELTTLKLGGTNVTDYSWLPDLVKIEILYINSNGLTDEEVIPVGTLPNLNNLYINNNKLTDLSTFQNMNYVELIQAERNNISDLSPLENYKNIQQINLKNNNIYDITPLTKVTTENANYIMLSGNHISDISGLKNLLPNSDLSLDASGQTVVLPVLRVHENETVYIDNPFKSIDGTIPNITNISPETGKYDSEKKQIIVENVSTISISGKFIFQEFDGHFGFSATVRQPIEFLVQGETVTAKYVDEFGNELAKSDTFNGDIGETYITQEKNILGWKLTSIPKNKTGTFSNIPQTVTYVYEKTEAAPVTVKYVDEQGKELTAEEELKGKVGEPYETTAKEIAGWVVKEVPANEKGTFTEKEQTVTYVYEKTEAAPVTVKYVDEQGKELTAEEELKGKVGEPYETTAKEIAGWVVKEVPANEKGTFTEKEQIVTYVYEKTEAAPVTVKYVDEQGTEIAKTIVLSGNIGDSYTTDKKIIEMYTFKDVQGNETGIFSDLEQVTIYIYKKNEKLSNDKKDPTLANNHQTGLKASSGNTNKKITLPKAGEQKTILRIVGIFILLGIIGIFYVKKNKSKN